MFTSGTVEMYGREKHTAYKPDKLEFGTEHIHVKVNEGTHSKYKFNNF